jgi:hypothetical protein
MHLYIHSDCVLEGREKTVIKLLRHMNAVLQLPQTQNDKDLYKQQKTYFCTKNCMLLKFATLNALLLAATTEDTCAF